MKEIEKPLTDVELILKAIEKAGGSSALAKEVGLHRSTVSAFKYANSRNTFMMMKMDTTQRVHSIYSQIS